MGRRPRRVRRNERTPGRTLLMLWLSAVVAGGFFLRWLLGLGQQRRRREAVEAQREAALRARRRPVRYLPPHIHPAERQARRKFREKPSLLILMLGGGLVTLVVILAVVWAALSWLTGEPFLGRAEAQSAAAQDEETGAELPLAPADDEGLSPASAGNRYVWTDAEAGLAQIPVERAIELLVERGYPTPEGGIGALPVITPTMTAAPETQSEEDMVSAGAALFEAKGCADCHRPDGRGLAPPLNGLFGSEERLASGEMVAVDEAYVRRSILEPKAQIVAGYDPIMPSFAEHLTEQELEQLIAYIRSIGREQP